MTNLFDSTTLPPEPLPPPGEAARALHLPGRIRDRVAEFDRRADKALDQLRGNPVARSGHVRRHRARRLRTAVAPAGDGAGSAVRSRRRRRRPRLADPRRRVDTRERRHQVVLPAHAARVGPGTCLPHPQAPQLELPVGPRQLGLHGRRRPLPGQPGQAAVVRRSRRSSPRVASYVRIHHASDVVGGVVTGVVLGRVARRLWPPPVDGNPFSGIPAVARRRNLRRG